MSVEKIIQIERSHRRVLLIAIAVIMVFGLYRWILAPHTEQLLAAEKYNSTLDEAIHKAEFMGNLQEVKKGKIEELTKESNRLRNQLFTSQEVRQFLASLPAVVNQAGCVIQSVSTVPETQRNLQGDGTGITPKKANVIFTGGYNDIIKFLGTLQNCEHKVWIESVRMDTGGAGKLKCQVLLTLYCIERVENTLYE
jgi:Tfp pilus assembly protein PilO